MKNIDKNQGNKAIQEGPINQLTSVLVHLKEYKSITSIQAINLYGCTRLSDVIYRLRKSGYSISTEIISVKNRYGHYSNCAIYHFEG